MTAIDDGKVGRARRDYVEPQLVNYGSIVDATGSFIADEQANGNDTNHDARDH